MLGPILMGTSPWSLAPVSVTVKSMADPQDLLAQIRAAFRTGQSEVSRHAGVRMLGRVIRSSEIEEAITGAEIVEKYADDKYGPSVLLLGLTRAGRPPAHPGRVRANADCDRL